jgi:hypothetical protein
MQFNESAPPERETDILRAAIQVLQNCLPSSWALQSTEGLERGPDARLRIIAPDGSELVAFAEVKRLISTRDVAVALDRLRETIRTAGDRPPSLLLIARYLDPAARERIVASGAGYIDVTGNLYIAADSPPLVLRDKGADKDPWRGPGRPRGTLKGPPAARVVRALVDYAPPYSVPELAARTGASTGATYRVVEFLEEQELIQRSAREPITEVRWRAILERWSRDYAFAESNTVATFLEPRGLPALQDRLRKQKDLDYVITGSMAVDNAAQYAPTRLAMIYVRDIAAAATELGLRTTSTGSNVALAAGDYDVVFERPRRLDDLRYAALSQVAVDLLTGPGRNPSEAVELLDWMERNESEWRN